MKITEVRVKRISDGGKLKAYCSITIDDVFVVHDLKLLEGEKGFFIAMPRKKTRQGEFRDIAHPIEPGLRENIQKLILDAYNNQKDLLTARNQEAEGGEED